MREMDSPEDTEKIMSTQNIIIAKNITPALVAAGFESDGFDHMQRGGRFWKGDSLGIDVVGAIIRHEADGTPIVEDAGCIIQMDEEGWPVRKWTNAESFLHDLSVGLVEPYDADSNTQSYTL